MNHTSIHIQDENPLVKLMDILEGQVFHVSLTSNWAKIYESGEIVPNIEHSFETTFGSSNNSYFKNKGCVSVFDYRRIHEKETQEYIYKCRPTRPLEEGKGITIFKLKPESYDHLMTWENWKNEDRGQMIVPYIEAGYPGKIPLSLVEEVIFVTMEDDHNSFASAILRARKNHIKS